MIELIEESNERTRKRDVPWDEEHVREGEGRKKEKTNKKKKDGEKE